jgi:hypothetical protein
MAVGMLEIGAETIGSPIDVIPGDGGMSLPGKVDYGTMPSDLIRDELAETSLIRKFLEQFGSELAGKDVSKLLQVLGDIGSGDADADDLRNVDLEDLKDIDGVEEFVSDVVNTVQELNALGDTTADDTTQDDFQTTSTQEIVDGYDDLTDDQKEAIDNAIVLGANVYTGKFGLPVITFPNTEAGGASAGGGASGSSADSSAGDSADSSSVTGGADASSSDSDTESKDSAELPTTNTGGSGGTGSQDESGSTGGIRTTSTGEGSDIVWTAGNPWENNPDGVHGGFILVDESGEWGKSGISRVQIEGTGVVIDIDWENGTYSSDYVFGSQDDDDDDKSIDTSKTDTPDSTTAGGATSTSGTASSGTPTNWVWDIVTSTWNPVYQGDVVADNAILSNTTDEPTSAPNITSTDPLITDTATSLLGDAISQIDTPSTTTNNTDNQNTKKNVQSTLFSDIQDLVTNTQNQVGSTEGGDANTNTGNTGGDDGNNQSNIPGDIDCNSPKVDYVPTGNPIEYANDYNNYSAKYDSECGDGGDGGGDDINGGGNTEFTKAGTYESGYCKTRGENGGTFVGKYHDGKGGFYEEERFEAACKSTKNTGGIGDGDGTGVGGGVSPGVGGPSEQPPPEEPIEQVAQPTMPSSPFTAEGEITYINPRMVSIIEPSPITQGLFGTNAMDGSAGLLGRLSMSNQQTQDFQQQFGQGQTFGELQGFNNLSMFDSILNRNYIG